MINLSAYTVLRSYTILFLSSCLSLYGLQFLISSDNDSVTPPEKFSSTWWSQIRKPETSRCAAWTLDYGNG